MRQNEKSGTPTEEKIRRSAVGTVLCDCLLILALVICLLTYIFRNNAGNYDQNIDNISNIAAATSQLIQSAIDNTGIEIIGAYNYCNGKSESEILDYLSLVSPPDSDYQLLKRNETDSTELYHVYEGHSTRKDENGEYKVLRYEDTALSNSLYLHTADEKGVVSYSQSFTNRTDALRYFAIFCIIDVDTDGKIEQYYLVKPQKESKILNQAQTFTQYSDVSVAICYPDGKYLACDDGFRGNNFYDYIYKYNDLSLDEKNELRKSVVNNPNGFGTIAYKDFQKRPCIFAYTSCGDEENWDVVISVPTSEFVAEKLLSFFPLTIIVFLVVLLAFNVIRLLSIVKKLRLSMKREIVANTSKSAFLSRMSHEIRTPLNAIIGYNTIAQNEMAEARDDISRKQAEMKTMDCLLKSDIASKHLLAIINDVLDMSAIEGGKLTIANEPFDFKGLITSLTTVFYSQAKNKGVEFDVIFDDMTEEWLVGDQMRLNQILTNLLSNAIKFTLGGGTVVLKINQSNETVDTANMHFEVIDSGIGMTQEYLTHIWTPFEQADSSISRRFGGSGLGLSITKTLVDLMGGVITVASTPDVGTTFSVDLSLKKADRPAVAESNDFSGINALVVDDDVSTCDYIRLLFEFCGAKCTAVTSGNDALKAISSAMEHGDIYSVCLVDWKMPQMDGIETIRRIRDIVGDEMPIIVLTAYDYSELADKVAEVGVSRFLSKPLFQSSLFDLLANISGENSPKSPEKADKVDFGGARVILAEDNAMNMEIAKTILGSAGLKVESALNGREAVAMFEASESGDYSMILMDIHMPEMNGYEATQAIRSSSHADARTIPIIAMTADAFAENVAEAYSYGMNAHIAKPIDISTLFETIKKFL